MSINIILQILKRYDITSSLNCINIIQLISFTAIKPTAFIIIHIAKYFNIKIVRFMYPAIKLNFYLCFLITSDCNNINIS